MANVTEDKLRADILENNVGERKISDEKYAPMLVKTILYSIMGALASGVVYGIVNNYISNLVK